MSRQYSPFAALSSREQLERWLEFQNTRLPYINGEVETTPEMAMDPPEPPKHRETTKHTPYSPTVSHATPVSHTPSAPQPTSAPLTFHQAQHRQYDAVIKRMTEAAKQTQQFHHFPLS